MYQLIDKKIIAILHLETLPIRTYASVLLVIANLSVTVSPYRGYNETNLPLFVHLFLYTNQGGLFKVCVYAC